MLKGLTRNEWLAWLGLPADRVPEALILRGTRNLKSNYERHKTMFRDVLEVTSPNGIFEDVFIGSHRGVVVGYASVYGDAMASEITHVFGAIGTPLVIQTGCCGALTDGILAGDIVCATSAFCGEGASQYYLPGIPEIAPSLDLLEMLIDLRVAPVALHMGPILTTSALLAEGAAEIETWASQGRIAVDMETASTFAVADYFRMKRISLLFSFDSPFRGDHMTLSDREKQARRIAGEQVMIDLAFAIIEGSHLLFA